MLIRRVSIVYTAILAVAIALGSAHYYMKVSAQTVLIDPMITGTAQG